MPQPDHALPETSPDTFSSLVVQYVEDYDSLGAPVTGAGANLALNADAKASASTPGQPPSSAVDGDYDTIWSAGNGPVQWIEVRLDGPQDVAGVRLTVGQFPAGNTIHRVLGRTSAGLQLLHQFEGFTSDGETLAFTPDQPWHDMTAVRVETRQSPSWVAWREVDLVAP
jgi:hypothetical protein